MSAATDITVDKSQPGAKRKYNYRFKPGAPTAYRKAYAHMMVDFCNKGYSLTAFAGHIRVSRACLNRWAESYPEFKEAMEIAKTVRTSSLEQEMLAEDSGPRINARIFALKNAAPEEWSDRQNIEINQTFNIAVVHANALDALSLASLPLAGADKANDINTLEQAPRNTHASLDDLAGLVIEGEVIKRDEG